MTDSGDSRRRGPGERPAGRPDKARGGADPSGHGKARRGLPPASAGPWAARDDFPGRAARTLRDAQLRSNLRKATTTIRAKRAAMAEATPDWIELCAAARAAKDRALAALDHWLEVLEASVEAAGGVVHWARDAAEANRIITGLVREAGADEVVKVKSITTDEIELNDALAEAGVAAVETDLAELIIQLAKESSSHFLVPAIHKNRTEIRDLFRRTIGPDDLSDEPEALAEAARLHLRRKFLAAPVGISGANFAVAETGTVGVVESEGNGRMCTTLPDVLISVMGIEKVVPAWRDLEPLLQLLPRSATGERMNPYNSLWTGVAEGDGPRTFHLVLLDNGRTRVLADPAGREALRCIRCSACLNVCPVYERVGGHAYGSVYQGPIGAILTPQLLGPGRADSLPFASSLCAACAEVCPVEIDIPAVLVHLRNRAMRTVRDEGPPRTRWSTEWLAMRSLAWALQDRDRYERGQRLLRLAGRVLGRDGWIRRLPGWPGRWTRGRDLKAAPTQSFREWWEAERAGALRDGRPPTADRRGSRGQPTAGSPADALERPRSMPGGADPRAESTFPGNRTAPRAPETSTSRDSAADSARDLVLSRIRTALVDIGDADRRAAVEDDVERRYRTAGDGKADVVELLMERLREHGARVSRLTEAELPGAVAAACEGRGTDVVVAPPELPDAWLSAMEPTGIDVAHDLPDEDASEASEPRGGLTHGDLDEADGVITGCAVAVAETGTLVLDGGPAQGRRALSLVPDYHLCIVRANDIVATVPQGLAALKDAARRARPLTLVSGPSATSDIELSRVEGVHGPRVLEVFVVV